MNSIAILITCHNRKGKTLSCLKSLFDQKGLSNVFTIEVYVVDDGCNDGTPKAIEELFPDVYIIKGTGVLYWNRGMHLAWKTAASQKDYDFYLWLNDDTFLFNNAIEILLSEIFLKSIVCGTTKSQVSNEVTYGAYISKPRKLLVPNGNYQNADYCNGNCVLIPRNVFQKLGNLDAIFHHALGDFDYSLRARLNSIDIKVAPEYIGICESHDYTPNWCSDSINVFKRLKNLYSPLSGCYPPEFFIFEKRHNGVFWAIIHVFSLHLRCIVPQLYNNRKK